MKIDTIDARQRTRILDIEKITQNKELWNKIKDDFGVLDEAEPYVTQDWVQETLPQLEKECFDIESHWLTLESSTRHGGSI